MKSATPCILVISYSPLTYLYHSQRWGATHCLSGTPAELFFCNSSVWCFLLKKDFCMHYSIICSTSSTFSYSLSLSPPPIANTVLQMVQGLCRACLLTAESKGGRERQTCVFGSVPVKCVHVLEDSPMKRRNGDTKQCCIKLPTVRLRARK